jgi:hypothetical protein
MTSLITTPRPWQRLFAANQTGTTITAPAPTTAQPNGDGVIGLSSNLEPPNVLAFAFFGAGADDNTAVARITGWRRVVLAGSDTIWVPTPLASLSLALSTAVGVAGAAVLDTDRFADSIAESVIYTTAKEIVGAATPENTIAIFNLDVKGHELIQVQVATGGSATSVNGLWSGF